MLSHFIDKPQESESKCQSLLEQLKAGEVDMRMNKLEEAFGTEMFTNALADVAHASAVKGLNEVPQTWKLACNVVPRNDFKSNNVMTADGMGLLPEVGEHGTTTFTKPTDRKEAYTLKVYEAAFPITMEAWANDETQVLQEQYRTFGQTSTNTLNNYMWKVILGATTGITMSDGNAMFDASNHANYDAAGGTLAIATLQAAITGMINQTDEAGTQVNSHYPKYLFCNPAEYYVAANLTRGPFLGAATTTTTNAVADFNITPVVVPELTATHWMLGADPAIAPCVEMGFYEGKSEPQISFLSPESDTTFYKRTRASKCQLIFAGIPKSWKTFFKSIP